MSALSSFASLKQHTAIGNLRILFVLIVFTKLKLRFWKRKLGLLSK